MLPVAPIAAATFYTVHSAALKERKESLWNVFEFRQWDRGLELRRKLVDAFCQGTWPPEWFVVAAYEPWLLQKLYKRMMRQWNGREFFHRAHQALSSSDGCAKVTLLPTLTELLTSPQRDDEWD